MVARKLKFCVNITMMFAQYISVLQRYEEAQRVGFRGVEMAFPYDIPLEEITITQNQTGLEQVLINAYPGNLSAGDLGLAGLPGREQEFRDSLEISLQYADALNCKRLHIMSGKQPGIENSEAVLKTLEANLRYALPELESRGIVGLLEPINKVTAPGYVLSDYDAALSVIKAIDSPFVRLQLDTFHLQQLHGDLTRRIKESLPYTGHVQIAQVPNRNEPHTPGEIEHGYLFDLLEELEYDGWIGLEYNPLNDTEAGLNEWLEKFNCEL